MTRMTEDDLLRHLDAEKDDARLQTEETHRTKAIRAYMRKPYGTEQAGRSQVVASDVFDTVEGMLPDLVDVFVSSDKAVVFDPVAAEDVAAAKQATEAVNHVFYKGNNGFLVLYTAAKDALLLRTGCIKWWWEEKRTPEWVTYRDVDEMQLAVFIASNPKAEIVGKDEAEPKEDGIPRFTVRVKTVKTKGAVRICAVPPDEIEISRRHNSLLLDECPYVAHVREVTLSEARELGYNVSVEDIKSATRESNADDWREEARNYDLQRGYTTEDESSTRGWLREEYALVDFDGDGIAERRRVVRLGKKVLENVEFSHVPMAIWSPYPITHRADGLSAHDLVEDFQRSHTEIWRNQLDNLDLANNQETVVLTDGQGNPLANIDDLLNRRPGGILRERTAGAIRPYIERWQGIEAMPMLEANEVAKERRTGYSPVVSGMDANALEKTATEAVKIGNERQKRMKLMARIMAEALVAPTMRGVFKTLTDYCMERLSFRLHGNFVQYDPQEWRDGYDMSINVGIGNGDAQQQQAFLMQMAQAHLALLATPMGQMVQPKNVYALHARMIEHAGFRNPDEFISNPEQLPPQSPPPPDPKLQIEQLKLQADAQRFQAQTQVDGMKAQQEAELERERMQLQTEVDARRQQYEAEQQRQKIELEAQLELQKQAADAQKEAARLEFERWKVEFMAGLEVQKMQAQFQREDTKQQVDAEHLGAKAVLEYLQKPRQIVRDETGEIAGVMVGEDFRRIQRDEMGNAIGLEQAPEYQSPAQLAEQDVRAVVAQALDDYKSQPREIVRDEQGEILGVNIGGEFRAVLRGAQGEVIGLAENGNENENA